jgi:protein required for attachment to host cells
MKTIWVVIADSARARIVASGGASQPFQDIEQLVHGESRLRDTQRISDRPGRSFDSHGEGRHAMEPGVDPADQEALRFATDIAHRIHQGRVGNEFDSLILVAPPRFLGMLRKAMDTGSRKLVQTELDKEFTQLDDEEIRRRLREFL